MNFYTTSYQSNKNINPKHPQYYVALRYKGGIVTWAHSWLSQSQVCGIMLWQSGAVQSGVFLNVTFDYQAISFTLLSAERKDEPFLDFAGVWYAKTQLSYMHPLYLICFFSIFHMRIFTSPLTCWLHTLTNECLLSCCFSLHWL